MEAPEAGRNKEHNVQSTVALLAMSGIPNATRPDEPYVPAQEEPTSPESGGDLCEATERESRILDDLLPHSASRRALP